MVFCNMSWKYVSEAECDLCDKNAGFEKDVWREICTMRFEHHPILDKLGFWTNSMFWDSFGDIIFKTFILIAWIYNKIAHDSRLTIWVNKDGWHLGDLKHSKSWAKSWSAD